MLVTPRRSCGREAEGGGLLNRYTALKPYRGFESLRLRHLIFYNILNSQYIFEFRREILTPVLTPVLGSEKQGLARFQNPSLFRINFPRLQVSLSHKCTRNDYRAHMHRHRSHEFLAVDNLHATKLHSPSCGGGRERTRDN